MISNMPMVMLNHVLSRMEDEEPEMSTPRGCRASAYAGNRGSCGDRYPYKKHHASFSVCPAFTPRTQQLDVREVDDAWIIFIDVPGYSKEDVRVDVDDGYLIVTATAKKPQDEASSSKAVWTERRRGDIQRKWKLPENAMLNAIHAKLNNGELVIAVAKKIPVSFQVPVLGPDGEDDDMETAQPAQLAPATIEAAPTVNPTPAAADSAVPEGVVDEQPATQITLAASDDAADAPEGDTAMEDDKSKETDGSWEDISDEEREAETAALKAKGKMPMEGPVLEEIERQEAEMRAAAADVDTD